MSPAGRFLRRLAINLIVFTVFLGLLWPLAGFGWIWEPRSAVFVGVSAATASILFALFSGMQRKVGEVTSAWLRVERDGGGATGRPLETSLDRDPPLSDAEITWIDRAASAAASVRERA